MLPKTERFKLMKEDPIFQEFSIFLKGRPDDIDQFYDTYAEKYEYICLQAGINDHLKISESIVKYSKDSNVDILDIGAGTGLVGKTLYEKGFRNFFGVDASDSMVKILNKVPAYKLALKVFVGKDELPKDFYEGFDFAVGSAIFCRNHVGKEAFEVFYKVLKPGGYMIFTVRDCLLDPLNKETGYNEKLEQVKKDRLFEEIERIPFLKYEGNIEGETVFGVDQSLTEQSAQLIVLKKL